MCAKSLNVPIKFLLLLTIGEIMKKEDLQICLDLLLQNGHVDVARRFAFNFKDDDYCQKIWEVIKPPIYKKTGEQHENS